MLWILLFWDYLWRIGLVYCHLLTIHLLLRQRHDARPARRTKNLSRKNLSVVSKTNSNSLSQEREVKHSVFFCFYLPRCFDKGICHIMRKNPTSSRARFPRKRVVRKRLLPAACSSRLMNVPPGFSTLAFLCACCNKFKRIPLNCMQLRIDRPLLHPNSA